MSKIINHISQPVDIAPLITFRVVFGALMSMGAIRFMINGWIERLYVEPQFFFKFYGFEWVEPLGPTGMYLVYGLIVLSAALVMVGLFYRIAIITFFLSFSYVELIDATNYLNHYYLVCLLAFLMIFLPANRAFSVDVWLRPQFKRVTVPAWTIGVIRLQLGIVYTFAGIAKLNPDWLFRAMPLAIWLPEHTDLPLIGWLFEYPWTAYAFSWAGAFYDLTIAFWLMVRKTRIWAYLAVIGFHVMTHLLFNIGLFPFIMIFSTLIFFPGEIHRRWWGRVSFWMSDSLYRFTAFLYPLPPVAPLKKGAGDQRVGFQRKPALWESPLEGMVLVRWGTKGAKHIHSLINEERRMGHTGQIRNVSITLFLTTYFLIQLLLPFRYLLYPSHLLWAEEGYRFSWRVMLVEKNGLARFWIHDPASGRKVEVDNSTYLTAFQEKQMSIQPDFMLQYAHFLQNEYQKKYQIENPIVTVESHVALNGRLSQPFVDPEINLATVSDDFSSKSWVLPFRN